MRAEKAARKAALIKDYLTNFAPRYGIGDYTRWWDVNRDEFVLAQEETDALKAYEEDARKAPQPDTLRTLLSVVGYNDFFSTPVKQLALRRIRRIPEAQEKLLAEMQDGSLLPIQRAWAAYALGELKSGKAVPALIKALEEKDPDLRGFAALALARIGQPEAVEALLQIIISSHENEDLRCLLLLALGRTSHPKAREAMAAIARKDPSMSARRAALLALAPSASPSEKALLKSLTADKEPLIRAFAMIALGITAQEPKLLEDALQDKDGMVRGHAALGLGICRNKDAFVPIAGCLLTDDDPTARACAALALGRMQARESVDSLTKALEDRNQPYVSCFAAIGLGLSGRPEALEPLVKGASGKNNALINACNTGLFFLKDERAFPSLEKSLGNRQYFDVPQFALLALSRLGKPEAFPLLAKALDDAQWGTRVAGAMSLLLYGDAKACPDLEKRLGDKQPVARDAAALAFDLLVRDEKRPLTLGEGFKGDPRNRGCRRVGPMECTRVLNEYLPKDFKLPLAP